METLQQISRAPIFASGGTINYSSMLQDTLSKTVTNYVHTVYDCAAKEATMIAIITLGDS